MHRDVKFYENKYVHKFAGGDPQSVRCYSAYSPLIFDSLAIQLKDKVSEIVGKKLHPTYSYARFYYEGAILEPHVDRPSCEYSTTLCIDSTDLWDFHIEDRNGKEKIVTLNPGDMCVYSGCELKHWRKPYHGNTQIQCFLHYVDSEGINAKYKYDEREMMGLPFKCRNKLIYQ